MGTPPPLKQLWTFITGANQSEKPSTVNVKTQTEGQGYVTYFSYNEKGELKNVIKNIFADKQQDPNRMLRWFSYSDDGCTEIVNFLPLKQNEVDKNTSDSVLNCSETLSSVSQNYWEDYKSSVHSLSDKLIVNSWSEGDDIEEIYQTCKCSKHKTKSSPGRLANSRQSSPNVLNENIIADKSSDSEHSSQHSVNSCVKYVPFRESDNCFLQETALDPLSRLQVIALQLRSSVSCANTKTVVEKSTRQALSDSEMHKVGKCTNCNLDLVCTHEDNTQPNQEIPTSEILPDLECDRFEFERNMSYIKTSINPESKLFASLYVQLPSKSSCFQMCNIKTELALALMKAFLLPWNDVHLYWIVCLQSRLCKILNELQVSPVFPDQKLLQTFDAVLVLSEDAACFIRHKELYFLKALGSVLEADPQRILLLRHKS